jgi:outer membrane protein insertion porin family/translocation and assembly module TamA
VLSGTISRDRTNNFLSPSRGYQFRVEARHASTYILSDSALQFNKLLAERSHYWGQPGGAVIAVRVRGGAVVGRTFGNVTGFIPPQERLYAGGPNSMRGFPQNELGSAIYISESYELLTPAQTGLPDSVFRVADSVRDFRRAVPTGGNSLILANLELRMPSPFLRELLQWAVFADAGDVWNRGPRERFQNFSIKVTPGIQLTAFSPVGPVRVVMGYNPYNRGSGPLYHEVPSGTPVDELGSPAGSLPCVSPRNTIGVHRTDEGILVQNSDVCPSTFTPRPNRSISSRLTFSLAIGQAF